MRIKSVLAAGLLAVGWAAVAAAPAHAGDGLVQPLGPIVCDPNEYDVNFTTTSNTRTITHAKYISIPSGGSGTVTRSVTKVGSITASVTFTSSATVSASAVMADFSGTVGVTLAASGTITLQSDESVTINVGPGAYAFFAGEKKFNGSYNGFKCNYNGTASSPLSGSSQSFAVHGEGAASCSGSYSSSSFEYKAKVIAC